MKLQQLVLIAVGMVIGLLLGVVAIGTLSESLSEDRVREIVAQENADLQAVILGEVNVAIARAGASGAQTRNLDEITNPAFMLVTMDQAAEWMEETLADLEELLAEREDGVLTPELVSAILAANGLSSNSELQLYLDNQVNAADGVLAGVYEVLQLLLNTGADENLPIEVCLGVENDLYSIAGPVLFLYLQMPDEIADDLPKDWELLDGPREESMLWSAECYDPETAARTLNGGA